MREISVFDVIGPNMIGPSSSHTAGALRIALMAKKMTQAPIKKVRFILYGSFAQTYRGHGTDDVDDSVVGLIRTEDPTITLNGAWAQNIGEHETSIDFMGTKAGIRLQYGAGFTVYGAKDGALTEMTPKFRMRNHFDNEIGAFLNCIETREQLPSHIDVNIITSRMMQAIYDSAEAHKEIQL